MRPLDEIIRIAAGRKGGQRALESLLSRPLPQEKIAEIPDDRWLSAMTKCVFQAGFNWQIIENKWDRFEEAFEGFDIFRCAMMSDDDLDRLLKTEGIVKNVAKIRSVGQNAAFLKTLADQYGNVGQYFAGWKPTDYCKNLRDIQKKGARLGGRCGQTALRRMGVDTIIFTPDVIKALKNAQIIDRIPGSQKDWNALQAAIDSWGQSSSRTLTEISRILAFSVD